MALCYRSTEESHVPLPFLQNMKLVLAQPVQQTSNAGPPSCALPSNHLETGGDFAPKKKPTWDFQHLQTFEYNQYDKVKAIYTVVIETFVVAIKLPVLINQMDLNLIGWKWMNIV